MAHLRRPGLLAEPHVDEVDWDVDASVGQQAADNPVRNAVCQRHQHNGGKRRDRLGVVAPVNSEHTMMLMILVSLNRTSYTA